MPISGILICKTMYIERSGWATNKGPVETKTRFIMYQQDWAYADCWLCMCDYLGGLQWVRYRKEDCQVNP